MKHFLPAANTVQTALMLSLMAVAAIAITACNRDGQSPAGNSPALKLTPTSSAVGSSPEQRLADTMANLWDLLGRVRVGEKSLSDWSSSDGDSDPAMNKASARFKQALRVLVGERAKTVPYAISYAARYELLVELLEKQQPEFGKKWRDGTFDPVLLHFGFGPIIGKWGSDPLPADEGPLSDGSMTVDEANKTVVGFCLLMGKEYLEPGLTTIGLEKQITERAGPDADRCLKECFHVTVEQWFAGQGPADFDYIAAVRQVMARYHPDIAGPLADFFAERFTHEVHFAQNDVKNKLAAVAKAEQSFVDRLLGGNGIYWTADMAGLYRYLPSDKPIGLIDPEFGGGSTSILQTLRPSAPLPVAPPPNDENLPKFGFAAVRGADGAVLDAHHYAFCAWPLGYGRIGRQTYLLVDPGKLFVKDTEGKPVERLPADLDADGWASIDFSFKPAVAAPASSAPVAAPAPRPAGATGMLAPSASLSDPVPTIRIDGLNRSEDN